MSSSKTIHSRKKPFSSIKQQNRMKLEVVNECSQQGNHLCKKVRRRRNFDVQHLAYLLRSFEGNSQKYMN